MALNTNALARKHDAHGQSTADGNDVLRHADQFVFPTHTWAGNGHVQAPVISGSERDMSWIEVASPVRGLELDGGPGNDELTGRNGADEIHGAAGDDTIVGGGGRDELEGGTGDDRLLGGKGRDTLEGGAGNDLLSGGGGADVFEFERGEGFDRILDFSDGQDRIALDEVSAADVNALISNAQQIGDSVVIYLGPDSSVTIENMQLRQLDAGDFLF